MSQTLLALLALAAAVDAPITKVTVFSDQAQVTRTAQVSVSGTQAVELPLLLDSVDASSIRVEASAAEVKKIDLAPVEAGEMPSDEAKRLLLELDQLDDSLALQRAELAALSATLENLSRLSPTAPQGDPLKPAPRLGSAGWSGALGFVSEYEKKLQLRSRELELKQKKLLEKREQLAQKAQQLGAVRQQRGLRVTATLEGSGPAKLELTYRVTRARWMPVYDLTLDPATSKVQVSFGGLVSQETGEDWNDASLTLSTAIPTTAVTAPKLLSWKIGEKERFIPKPQPMPAYIAPPPPASPPMPREEEADAWRTRLQARLGQAQPQAPQVPQAWDEQEMKSYAPPPPPRPSSKRRSAQKEYAPRAAPPSMPSEAPAAAPSMEFSGDYYAEAPEPPPTGFSLAPPPAFRRPVYAPNLPASLAGGYDLVFHSLRKETVASGKGERRVALLSERWPVLVERKLFPALAPEAFLVAELKSPASQPLPGGAAQLFVGADPAGTAQLKLVSPGEALTLPLGLDRALKPIRNVRLVTAEKGFIGKDEVSQYVVTIEVANPYKSQIPVRLFDQWPVTDDEHVEIKLLESKPLAIQDKEKGSLEWRMTLPPSGKSTVSFTYSIRRPKGWRMHQN